MEDPFESARNNNRFISQLLDEMLASWLDTAGHKYSTRDDSMYHTSRTYDIQIGGKHLGVWLLYNARINHATLIVLAAHCPERDLGHINDPNLKNKFIGTLNRLRNNE